MSLRHKALTVRQFFYLYAGVLVGLLLISLGLSGRLHWLFALLGAALPFIVRSLPIILRLVSAASILKWLRRAGGLGGFAMPGRGGAAASSGQQSELNTRFLAMVLDHDTGDMDGQVLEGSFKGSKLSDLSLTDLLSLREVCREDSDSLNVLEAWLDRAHPDWADAGDDTRQQDFSETGNLDEHQAREILGLKPDAGKKEIVEAHRRLIQKLHPDHGGSSYLAARINEAKRVLLGKNKRGDDL